MTGDPRRFIFNSDYKTPYLVLNKTGTISVGGGIASSNRISFSHGLNFKPLLVGQWSTNNFYTAYELSVGTPIPNWEQFNISADNNNVYVEVFNLGGGAAKIQFRVSAYVPSDYKGTVIPVDDSTHFKFSTDYNYLKIVDEGFRDLGANSSVYIPHNLGYLPQCKIWREEDGIISPVSTSYSDAGALFGAEIGTSGLVIGNNANLSFPARFHYQIYGDEA